MYQFSSLKNKLLIASPHLQDGCFQQSLIFLYEHQPEGSVGFIVNKLLPIKLGEILEEVGVVSHTFSYPKCHHVLEGGPLHPHEIFLMHPETNFDSEFNLFLIPPREALLQFATDRLPSNIMFLSGYAAWEAGQLENEFKKNLWWIADLNKDIFDQPYHKRWKTAAQLSGINLDLFLNQVGHG